MSNKKGFSHESHALKTVDWYTPPHIFEDLGLTFDLDPCAPLGGVSWIPAANHYALPDDGLALPWKGRIWCNPPYGKHTAAWLAKMSAHGDGIALVFARTDCRWFHTSVATADAILFLKGRVKFVDAYGVTGGNGAGAGSMLVAWGHDNERALFGMRDRGLFVRP